MYCLLILNIIPAPSTQLAGLDWLIIGLYLLGMLAVGWYFSYQNSTEEDYLLGGRRMNPYAVGISLFATLQSTLSYLSYPGEIIKNGPLIFAGIIKLKEKLQG